MKLKFFDANVYIGQPTIPKGKPIKNANELIKEMDKYIIEKSLVWHIAQRDVSPEEGNELLNKEISDKKRLFGCWTILPPQTEEVIRQNFFEQMKKNRIYALRIFPKSHNFILDKIVFKDFFIQLIEKNIPVIIDTQQISYESIYTLLKDFPDLECILCDIGIWSVNRYIWPLLEKFQGIFIETSLLALEDGGIEETVKRFGSDRIIFGTGLPERYPEASIVSLLHADISDEDKEKIAYKNMEKIILQVKL
jgi:predicted TIM-barrel fold metal-dependent hydrolase